MCTSPEGKHLTVTIFLADGSQYPHEGDLTFIDNVVDPEAGTLTMRATLPNPEHRLRPGQVVQVRLLLKEQSDALLIPEKAVRTLQGGTFVLVVGTDDKVEQRRVRLGPAYSGNRVVESGLHAGERVITEGLQKVKAGMVVKPTTASDSAQEGQRPGEHGQAGSN
jgi:membrane fusion protein (multidrug efflux system)